MYLIRHAEAEGNWRRLFQGHLNGAVSEKGERQLDLLAARFEAVQLDALYSSPLIRAVQTAEAVNRHARLPVVLRDELMEIHGGAFEGLPFSELPILFPDQFTLWEENPCAFTAPEGETMRAVFARMRDAIDRITRENAGKTIAVVSHGCAIRNYQCYASGWEIEELNYVPWCDNTAVSCIEYDAQFAPHICYLSDSTHLPQDASTLATQDWWQKTPKRD